MRSLGNTLLRNTLLRNTLLRNTLLRNTLLRNTLLRNTLLRNTLLRNTLLPDKASVNGTSGTKRLDTFENAAIDQSAFRKFWILFPARMTLLS